MTSKVEVDAHAGWPMKVTAIDTYNGETKETELATVAPGDKQVFHVHDSRKLLIEELKRS